MSYRFTASSVAAALVLAFAGCDEVAGPEPLQEFTWGEVAAGEVVEDGIDVSQALGDVFILGELNTPTRCYGLEANLDVSGSSLTLTIDADSNQSGDCALTTGAYRYTAVLRALAPRDYQVRVRHSIENGRTQEFTAQVTVR